MNRPKRTTNHKASSLGKKATWLSCVLALVLALGGGGALLAAQSFGLLEGSPAAPEASSSSETLEEPPEEEDPATPLPESAAPQEEESSSQAEASTPSQSADEIRTKALAAVTNADLDWLSQEARDSLVSQLSGLPEAQWPGLISAQEEQKPVPPTREEAQAAVKAAQLTWLDDAASEALISRLLGQDKSGWDAILAGEKTAYQNAQLRQKASDAVDEADLDWMTRAEKEKLIDQLAAQPTQNWAGIIGGQEKARRQAAQNKVDAASLSWLTEEDREDFISALAGQASDQWDSLIEEKQEERDDYIYGLAEKALDDYDGLDWLTGKEREEFLQELVEMRRGQWKSAMKEKAEEKPEEEEEEEDTGSQSSGEWGELTVSSGTYDAYDLVCWIVSNEMGRWTNQEALKAQALAAYSYVKYENSQGRTPSVGINKSPSSAIKKAVSAVEGEMITYNGRVAYTTYYAISSGRTNNSADVWGGHYDYLVSVDSSIDKKAKNYEKEYTYSVDEMEEALEDKLDIDLEGDPEDWIKIRGRNDGDYVTSVRIDGQKTISGRYLRESVLGLRSAAFDVDYDDDDEMFTITTYGYGHGVGMSQWGAYLYATEKGWDYKDILKHYYPGTRVK